MAFYKPTVVEFGLIGGYTHKFGRFVWNTQLNVSNVFNHYKAYILRNSKTAYISLGNLNATFTTQPRAYVWTNTLNF